MGVIHWQLCLTKLAKVSLPTHPTACTANVIPNNKSANSTSSIVMSCELLREQNESLAQISSLGSKVVYPPTTRHNTSLTLLTLSKVHSDHLIISRSLIVGMSLSSSSTQPFALRQDPTQAPKPQAFRADLNVRLVCPDCQDENPQLVEEFGSGDLVCGGCGEHSEPRINNFDD